jgi:hypothetical protein
MITISAPALFGLAAILTSIAALIWAIRRSPNGPTPMEDNIKSNDAEMVRKALSQILNQKR